MEQLECLGLKANGWHFLSESVGSLTNLKTLDLDSLLTFPESIKQLTRLKRLYFSYAKFSGEEFDKI